MQTTIQNMKQYFFVYLVVVASIWLILSQPVTNLLAGFVALQDDLLYIFLGLVGLLFFKHAMQLYHRTSIRQHLNAFGGSLVLSAAIFLALQSQLIQMEQFVLDTSMLLTAFLLGYFEIVFIYSLVLRLLRERYNQSILTSVLITALLYTIYHIGYYGPTALMENFALSAGLYMMVGTVNASLILATRSPFVIFPAYLLLATIYDLARTGIQPDLNLLLMGGLVGLIVLISVYLFIRSQQAVDTDTPDTDRASTKALLKIAGKWFYRPALYGGKTRLIVMTIIATLLFGVGTIFRFIIFDPVPTDSSTWAVTPGLFVQQRVGMVDAGLFFGLAGYLIIPLMSLIFFYDARSRQTVLPLSSRQVYGARILGSVVFITLITLFSLAIGIIYSLSSGFSVTAAQIGRFLLVGAALQLYALMCMAWVTTISSHSASSAWSFAITLFTYMIIYNYWMIYPLFSQYWAVTLPSEGSLMALQIFMGDVFERSSLLYAWVPQYNYYIATAVATMQKPFAPEIYLPSMGNLLVYTTGFVTLAWLSLQSSQTTREEMQ